jgi:asparagine synthase (glutamine-hydrolysing)
MTNGLLQMNNIQPVDPGSYIEYDIESRKIEVIKFYVKKYLNFNLPENTEAFHIRQLRKILTQSVHDRLAADAPVGIYLSGGLDSPIIGAIAAKKK